MFCSSVKALFVANHKKITRAHETNNNKNTGRSQLSGSLSLCTSTRYLCTSTRYLCTYTRYLCTSTRDLCTSTRYQCTSTRNPIYIYIHHPRVHYSYNTTPSLSLYSSSANPSSRYNLSSSTP